MDEYEQLSVRYVKALGESMEQTKDEAWGVNVVERIRVRIMTEAYDLADRGDIEGYNAIKLMCHEVLQIIEAHGIGEKDEYRCV